jgi:hypothetical protein
MPGVVETRFDYEGGWAGQSSLYRLFWVKYAKRVAKAALRQVEQEAESLKG